MTNESDVARSYRLTEFALLDYILFGYIKNGANVDKTKTLKIFDNVADAKSCC